jgi:hypothetical protein
VKHNTKFHRNPDESKVELHNIKCSELDSKEEGSLLQDMNVTFKLESLEGMLPATVLLVPNPSVLVVKWTDKTSLYGIYWTSSIFLSQCDDALLQKKKFLNLLNPNNFAFVKVDWM